MGEASVSMGSHNSTPGNGSAAFGLLNTASGQNSLVAGSDCGVNGSDTFVVGFDCNANGDRSAAIGSITRADGFASIATGSSTTASGDYSTAMGRRVEATNSGTFVWGDNTTDIFRSTSSNQFLIRASGGVGINTNDPAGYALSVNGNVAMSSSTSTLQFVTPSVSSPSMINMFSSGTANLDRMVIAHSPAYQNWGLQYKDVGDQFVFLGSGSARIAINLNPSATGVVGIGTTTPTNTLHVAGGVSATAFVTTSDRNAKENFKPVAPLEVLNKVAALPISTWNFKTMNDGAHMGPMAQDFYAAFGLGGGDTTITSVDPDGVALAAIQGLNQKLEETRSENAALKARLEKIEALLVHQLNISK